MDSKILVKQFGSDPGAAFLETIRVAPSPVRAADIKREIIDAGARKPDVDRHWKRLQPVLKLHPQVRLASNRYAWVTGEQPARSSLAVLAGQLPARVPGWLAQALIENVSRGLAGNGTAEPSWADREFEKARLVAELAVAVEVLRARGASLDEVTELFAEESRRKRLWPIGRADETVSFDPGSHEPVSGSPPDGATVRVVRPGYVWRGGGESVVAAKAAVAV